MRTRLKDRVLPTYTRGEERFNMISHIVGGAIGIAALVLCIVRSALHHNGFGLAGSIVFGVSMILLYTMSSIYHGLREGTAKKVLQVLNYAGLSGLVKLKRIGESKATKILHERENGLFTSVGVISMCDG